MSESTDTAAAGESSAPEASSTDTAAAGESSAPEASSTDTAAAGESSAPGGLEGKVLELEARLITLSQVVKRFLQHLHSRGDTHPSSADDISKL